MGFPLVFITVFWPYGLVQTSRLKALSNPSQQPVQLALIVDLKIQE